MGGEGEWCWKIGGPFAASFLQLMRLEYIFECWGISGGLTGRKGAGERLKLTPVS